MISAACGTVGNSHPSGRTHATYQGSRTGPSRTRQSSPQPHEAPTSDGPTCGRRRQTARTISATATTKTPANSIRGTHPSVSPERASNIRRNNRDGASQPSCDVSSTAPSVGSSVFANGAAATTASPAAIATCGASAATRSPRGRRAATAIQSRSSGSAAVTFTSAPIASANVAQRSRPENTSAIAEAIVRATMRSLCPLAAPWNSTVGFRPTSTIANASYSGRSCRTRRQTTRTVARLAAIAISRNAAISAPTSSNTRVTTAEACVQSAPYTAGVSNHFGPTNAASASFGKSAGVATYGLAW